MVMDRRIFVLTSLGAGMAAAVANFLSQSSTPQARRSPLPNPLPTQLIPGGTDMNSVVFKLDGWDCCDIEISGSTMAAAHLLMREPTENYVLIKMSQSWRTTSWC